MNYVYLIGNKNVGLYKIGATNSLKNRLKTNQTGCPYNLEIIHFFESEFAYKVEKLLHKDFILYKKDDNDNDIKGEWFALQQEHLDTFLSRCASYEKNFRFLKESDNHFFNKTLKK
jgi:hypothetical protein